MPPVATIHKVRLSRSPTYEITTETLGTPKLNTHQVIQGVSDIDEGLSLVSIDQRQGRRFVIKLEVKPKSLTARKQLLGQVFAFLANRGLIAKPKARELLDSVTA